jgi:N-ethylmaleimide reductase
MSTATTTRKLFTAVNLGAIQLGHRVVMAPLTRSRSTLPGDVPNDLMAEYYGQRASSGGLIIGEATSISASSRGWLGAPGLFTDAQVAGWRKVIAAVHAKGGKMIGQLWHTGRASHIDVSGTQPVSASVNPSYWQNPDHLVSAPAGWVQPSPHRALAIDEIPGILGDYRKAAQRARDAGFDGIELHAANG